jgi:hypothetical protein
MHHQGYSVEEIAFAMGLRITTVKKYLRADTSSHRKRYLESGLLEARKKDGQVLVYDGHDSIDDMVQYKDKYGIVRWRKP